MSNITKVEADKQITESYMIYAMSTITDRALPDIRDGMKPVHRRLLYSMYKKGITSNSRRAKSSEPVAETMKIHHHGDTSIYEALALMTEQNESLLYPLINGEGAFGKVYSKDSPSAMRYTSCKLNKFSEELFKDIKKNIVTFIGEDKEHMQPVVLPCTYPSLLIKPNNGIAVGEACNFGSFNLDEVIDTTIAYIKDKDINIIDYLIAPDFSTGGQLIYNKKELEKIYSTGKGAIKLRSKYRIDKANNCIEIYEIPYNTTVNDIVVTITGLMKQNDFKDVLDVRDETGYNKKTEREELKITIDIKKNTNIDLLMTKLFRKTPLEKTFSFNMNCLINYRPRVIGIKEILNEWLKFRIECIKKILGYDIKQDTKQLHFLKGLEKVLLDIDKAIEIIRKTDDNELIDKLCSYFEIDKEQSESIVNMKLRNINKEYIIKQIKNINNLEAKIKLYKYKLSSDEELDKLIISDLERVKNTYSKPRKTEIIYEDNIQKITKDDLIDDYSCNIIYTKENYLKKTLRYSESQKVKDGDEVVSMIQTSNKGEVILFSNRQKAYKIQINDIDTKQPSNIGLYIPTIIELDAGEKIIGCAATSSYKGYLLITYENGRIHKLPLESFKTNTKRTVLKNTLIDENIVSILQVNSNTDLYLESSQGKAMIINTSNINEKSTRSSQGITIMSSNKEDFKVSKAEIYNNQVDESYRVEKKSSGKKI